MRLVDIDDERFWDILFNIACVEGVQERDINEELNKLIETNYIKKPCNIDDFIYEFSKIDLTDDNIIPEEVISKRQVRNIIYMRGEWYMIPYDENCTIGLYDDTWIPALEIGKTIFFSYDEAEQVLKDIVEGNKYNNGIFS
jgi:hypothetical protein